MLVPLGGNTADRSASVYSLALAFFAVMRRWTRRVIPSALPRRRGNHSLWDKLSHPARTSRPAACTAPMRSEEHTSELQSRLHLVCRLLLEKKKKNRRHRQRVAT